MKSKYQINKPSFFTIINIALFISNVLNCKKRNQVMSGVSMMFQKTCCL